MTGLAACRPELRRVRRVITRPADPDAEDHDSLTEAEFEAAVGAGAYCLHWRAHGLRYGICQSVLQEVAEGRDALVNLSRSVLEEAAAVFPKVVVLSLTARKTTLEARLAQRGRETERDIATRLARPARSAPEGVQVITLSNDGPLKVTINAALAALYPQRA
jgi:ribose 1,5-bisphosphokinase